LPDYINANYESFAQFIEDFYRWNDTEGPRSDLMELWDEYLNINECPEAFVDYFMQQYANKLPLSTIGNRRLFAKHIRDFYRAKGTERAYELLFRLLYGENVDIYYPKDDTAKSSDIAATKRWMVAFEPSVDLSSLENTLMVQGDTTAYLRYVYLSNTHYYGIIENLSGTFVAGSPITIGSATEQVTSIITGATITDAGTNNGLYDIVTSSEDSTFLFVSSTSSGPLNTYTINDGGLNYVAGSRISVDGGATAIIRAIDGSGTITLIEIEDGGWYSSNADSFTVESAFGTGADITFSGSDVGKVESVVVAIPGYDVSDDTLTFTGNATGIADFGTALLLPTYESGTRASDDTHLLDSFYYQNYSYELRSEQDSSKYREAVKEVLHPVGYELFSERIV